MWSKTKLIVGYLCYDDGCHLLKYTQKRSQLTKTAEKMKDLTIVIDSMYMKGHTDSWCKRSCDPKWFPQLNNVRKLSCIFWIRWYASTCRLTQKCVNNWLSHYRHMARHMNRTSFMFFVLYICDLHNLQEEAKLKNAWCI